jgi:NAD(P)-dependent dehydrogenase (short-subunit alcohol dehydrogenase family)
MSDRTAIITGAAQGVGEATARRLLKDGIGKLLLVDMDAPKLEAVAASLRKDGADVAVCAGDLSEIANCAAAVGAAMTKFGRIDILANCAGSTVRGGILDTSEETFDRLFAVNVKAPFFMIQHAAKEMQKRRSGVIVNISSMLAHGGPPFLLTYSATKAALVAVTKSAANALKRDNVRLFAINLGWTVTPTERRVQTEVHGMPEDWAEMVGQQQPFGRLLMPDDPAGLISFLVSPDARMMTGAIIDLEQFVIGTTDAALGAVKP